jgi:hypothetical protein
MEVTNNTPYDAHYKVSGGGTPMGPHGHSFPADETNRWPVIPAGGAISHSLNASGPCRVYFFVNGHGIVADANSDQDHVNLLAAGEAFRAEVRKVPRSTRDSH